MVVTRDKIQKIYDDELDLNDMQIDIPKDVVSFTEIRSCADIYRMYESGVLSIQPDFQREVVWDRPNCTRFIDSIIKSLPIPSMCFSYDAKRQKWMIIDGLQRVSTIIDFFEKSDVKYSVLDDVEKTISGRSPKQIFEDKKSRNIITKIENQSLPITILWCDHTKSKHLLFLFSVFYRLNSNGIKLNAQEIRNCIYAGKLNEMLRVLNSLPEWEQLNGINQKKMDGRMRCQELILRFFAYQYYLDNYGNSLTKFLNDFMHKYQHIETKTAREWSNFFKEVVCLLAGIRDRVNAGKRMSMVVQDALLYGIGKNLNSFSKMTDGERVKKIQVVLDSDVFSDENMSEGIARKEKVLARLKKVQEALS